MCEVRSILKFAFVWGIIVLLIALFLSSRCEAETQTRKVALIVLKGPYSISLRQSKAMFQTVKKFYSPIGYNLVLVRNKKINDPCKRIPNTLDANLQKYACLALHFYVRKDLYPGQYKHYFVAPPMIQGGVSWQGGFSSGICKFGRSFSMGNAIAKRIPTGEDRLQAGAIVCGHELGHQYGCKHYDTTINLMHSNAGYYSVNGYFHRMIFEPYSIDQLYRCEGPARQIEFQSVGEYTPVVWERGNVFS